MRLCKASLPDRPSHSHSLSCCRLDALVYSSAVLHESFPFTYHLPGWVATLALVLMNLMSRDDLAEATNSYGGDDGEAVGLPALPTLRPAPEVQAAVSIANTAHQSSAVVVNCRHAQGVGFSYHTW